MRNIQNILENAYNSFSPLESLLSVDVCQEMLDLLIPKETNECIPISVKNDILTYHKQRDEKWSEVALQSKFIHFATSMIHVFIKSRTAVTYLVPNVPMPYIWIDVLNEETFKVCSVQGLSKNMFRLIIHTVKAVDEIRTVKKAINLATLEVMPFINGNSIQVCYRADLENPIVSLIKPNLGIDCIVILSFRGEFNGCFHKSKEKLICAVH